MSPNNFLRAFYPGENETIHFRAFKPKDAPDTENNKPAKFSATRKTLAQQGGELELRKLNHLRGVYFVVNAGGNTDSEITRYNAVFVENDDLPLDEQIKALEECLLAPSIQVRTKRSIHAYWLIEGNCSAEEWRDVQSRLIHYFNADASIKNPSRLMRVPGFMHLTYNENASGNHEAKPVELTQFHPERRYTIQELKAAFPPARKAQDYRSKGLAPSKIIGNGHRNATLFSLACSMRHKGLVENEIVAALSEVNRKRVSPPLDNPEIVAIARSAMRYDSTAGVFEQAPKPEVPDETETKSLSIPTLSEIALYGLAGEIVRAIEPHTEADNAALLLQFLTGFGCLINKTAHFRAEADNHYTKIFGVIVGASSKSRKGTSWGQIKRLLCRVDETFEDCMQDGLSSGEGLIYHVRDPHSKKVPIKQKGRIVDYQDELVDEGANEKRSFVVEPEFARVLRVMQREGNTLSSIIRQAWDTDRLKVMTKTPLKASNAHISLIGHITSDELRRNLDETETANGFANRFLWIFARRSKYLPEGGNLEESQLNHLVEKLNRAKMHAGMTGELKRDERARQKWLEIYPKLSDGHTGLLGSVTSRAEAQVMRLACLYALLDCAEEIRLEHLDAALAFWQYCEDSARYIFGDQSGNKTADAIYAALQGSEVGLTRTDIRDLFQRNASAAQVNSAIKLLIELGRVEISEEKTDGRPREIIKARRYDKNDFNDQRS